MSNLSDSEVCIPKITPFLSIPELIGVVKRCFRERDFNEVQNILMERQRKMGVELEYASRDLESLKRDAALVERSLSLEKERVEGKLRRCEGKCGELEEAVRRLEEEKGVCLDRAKGAEEMCEKVSRENLRVMKEKRMEIDELESRILEKEGLVGVYREKLESRVREMEELRRGKLGADQTVEELRRKQVEVDKVVEELKEKIKRLSEEEGVCAYRATRAEERYKKVFKENLRMMNEKNKEINDLEIRILENEGLVGEYHEILKCRDARIVEMDREMEDLRRGKLEADLMVEELRRKQVEVDKVVEEMKGRIFELERERMDYKVVEEKLQRSERECEELKKKIKRLSEEERICLDREKRAEEMYEKVSKENLRMMNEKNKEINDLEIRILENEGLVGEYCEKLKCTKARIVEMEREMEELRRGKLGADKTVEELRRKQVEVDKVVEELKARILELGWEKMRSKANEESEGKCEELKEKIRRSRVCLERAREGWEKFSQVTNEKNKIFELNEKINVLERRNLEDHDKLKRLNTGAAEMRQEMEDLRRDKLCADQTVEELRRKQVEADKVVEELKSRNLELGMENMESKKALEVYKSRFENLAPRVAKVEVELAGILNVKVVDLASIIQNMEKSGGGAEEECLDLRGNFKGHKGFLASNSTGSGGVGMSKKGLPGNFKDRKDFLASNSTGSGGVGMSKKARINLDNSQPKEDGEPAVGASGCKPFRVESNDTSQQNVCEELQVSGSGAQRSSKAAHPSSAAADVILIVDSDDDEANPGATSSAGQAKKRRRLDFTSGKF